MGLRFFFSVRNVCLPPTFCFDLPTASYVVDFPEVSHTGHACRDSGEENIPFNSKKLPSEPGLVQMAICHDRLGT